MSVLLSLRQYTYEPCEKRDGTDNSTFISEHLDPRSAVAARLRSHQHGGEFDINIAKTRRLPVWITGCVLTIQSTCAVDVSLRLR